jgi:hypothetical protein
MQRGHFRGIISDHFRAAGTVTRDMVRQRAEHDQMVDAAKHRSTG